MEKHIEIAHQDNWKNALIYIMNNTTVFIFVKNSFDGNDVDEQNQDLEARSVLKAFILSFVKEAPERFDEYSNCDLNELAHVMVDILVRYKYIKIQEISSLSFLEITPQGIEIALKIQENDINVKRSEQQTTISRVSLFVSVLAFSVTVFVLFNSNALIKLSEERIEIANQQLALSRERLSILENEILIKNELEAQSVQENKQIKKAMPVLIKTPSSED